MRTLRHILGMNNTGVVYIQTIALYMRKVIRFLPYSSISCSRANCLALNGSASETGVEVENSKQQGEVNTW
jgi:hypothetical protein